jgi:DNA polymerase III subunit gamma/tau
MSAMSESHDDTLGFDLGEQPKPAAAAAYRVLARKYRPQRFSELIGQDAMVQTLANAIKRDRLAHAFLLTGVRGVGKTSTARLIAKALNCIGPDGQGGPTIDPCGICDPCVSITEGRHMDVVEMDAASNTGVDDVREIIEAVRYSAVSARYKVYIIDEVHMLSKNAFNALLKTLEEPPPHVKFLFATTEVNKVPITVLSRCQRFDLRRISSEMLTKHFAEIVSAEKVSAEHEALSLIARAAEGSVRDGLSILDQAIAHADIDGDGKVTGTQVRDMLGLSDRGAVRRLFGFLLSGDAASTMAALADQRDLGVDPVAVLRGLLELTHGITLAKVGAPVDSAQSVEERTALDAWADKLSFALLHRLWQLLLKGHDDVTRASQPNEAADMALLRVIHASQLPDPGEFIRKLEAGEAVAAPSSQVPATDNASTASVPADFPALIALLEAKGKQRMGLHLHDDTGLVRYAPPELVLSANKPLPTDFARDLGSLLKSLTNTQWAITFIEDQAAPTLKQQDDEREAVARDAILAEPLVKAAFDAFPDAELIDYSQGAPHEIAR